MKPDKTLYFDEEGATLFTDGKLTIIIPRVTESTRKRISRLYEAERWDSGVLRAGMAYYIRDKYIRRTAELEAPWWNDTGQDIAK